MTSTANLQTRDSAMTTDPVPHSPGNIRRRGLMMVISSPSGAGKTTIAEELRARDANITRSISVTTRPMRPGEQDGVDYHFIDRSRFDQMVANGELLEHATVFGNSYGTPRAAAESELAAGRDVLFAIDWQGAEQLNGSVGPDLVSVFILPPTASELERRLRGRGQDPEDVIAHRMSKASSEISHWTDYDYVIINREVEESVAAVQAILGAERLRRSRQTGLADFAVSLQTAL